MYTTWPHAPVSPSGPLFRFFWAPHVEEPSLVETLETPELLVVVVVVEINSCTTSAPAPSTADRFPVTLTDKLVSPKALEACRVNRSKMVQDMERVPFCIENVEMAWRFKNIRPTSFFQEFPCESHIYHLNSQCFPQKKTSASALAACDKKGVLVDKLERLKAAIPTDESSEDILSSNVTTPLSAKRRASETEMETAPGGNREALATTRAKFSCAVRSKPRVRPSKRKVCLKPTTCKVQSFNGRKEPCK